jgi:putative flippase GtrA
MLRGQIIKYGIIGIGSNAALFVLYLLLTFYGMEPKVAMSLLYISGVSLTYLLNHRWTFTNTHVDRKSFSRYLAVYISGYILNFFSLYFFVDVLALPHQVIQGIMIIIIACLTFTLLRLWVFKRKPNGLNNAN